MRKKSIQKMAFVDPYGKNVKHVKKFIYKIIDELLKKVSNAEKFPPLPKKKIILINLILMIYLLVNLKF